MNKTLKAIFTILFIIIVILFIIFLIIPFLNDFIDATKEINKKRYEVSTRKMDVIKYGEDLTQPNSDLTQVYTDIIKDFENNNEFEAKYDNIDNFYTLQPYFLEYKLYLSAKYKVNQVVENIPMLLKDTNGLSRTEMESYLKKNEEKTERIFGIKTQKELEVLINTLKGFKNEKIVLIPESVYHNVKEKRIQFGVNIGDIKVNFTVRPYYSNKNQPNPYVKVLGIDGGAS